MAQVFNSKLPVRSHERTSHILIHIECLCVILWRSCAVHAYAYRGL